MTAKKTGEFSGKPGPRLSAHNKVRLALAYKAVENGAGKATALKRACLQHPQGLKPAALAAALKTVPSEVALQSKIGLKSYLSLGMRADLDLEIDRLRKAFDSNLKFHGVTWVADLHLGDDPDHDADIDDGLLRVK